MAFLFILLTTFILQDTSVYKPDAQLQSSDSLIARNWTVEEGLPVNAVNNVVQDDEGYIWFTTYDGIVRFDGINFKIYNRSNTPEMPQNRAVNIYHQKDTGIWVSLENGGILLITDNNTRYFGEEEGLPRSDLTTMYEDSQGQMWFGTYGGLYTYKENNFTRIYTGDTSSQNRINSIFEGRDHSIWAPTYDGLVHVKNGHIQVYNRDSGTVDNEFTTITYGPDQQLLVGTRTGLLEFKDGIFTQPDIFTPLNNAFVTALHENGNDNTWLISTDRGLYQFNGEGKLRQLRNYQSQYQSYQHFYQDSRGLLWMIKNDGSIAWFIDDEIVTPSGIENLPDYHFNRIMEDREGNIWLTTARNGIVRITQSRAQTIGKPEGLSGSNILGLFEDSRGRFWVGTRDAGINIIDGDQIIYLSEDESIASDIVHTINEDHKGNIWVGYYQQGIDRFNEDGVKNFTFGSDAFRNDVRAIHVSEDSTIWLGTYNGLIKFDPEGKNHTTYTKDDGLTGNLVRYIDEAPDGSLWIATGDGGVSHFKDGNFINYTMNNGLSADNIRSVYVDQDDSSIIWVGTEVNGLNRIRNDSIDFVNVDDGLPDHIIHYIAEDSSGWLWMSSNRGVIKIHKGDLNNFLDGKSSNFRMAHYGKAEGMRNPECNGSFQKGGVRTSNGNFWFSTQEGISVFNIYSSRSQDIATPVGIDHVFVNGEQKTEKEIKMEPGANDFRVHFHAITFVSPEKTVFRYKLDGYDDVWQESIGSRDAYYTDVSPGEYTFRVMAAGNDGRWSINEASVTIGVTPMFYQRWWFYGILFLLIGIGYYGFSAARYRYLMYRQQKMQTIINEQTAELRKEKSQVEQKNEIIRQQADELELSNKTKDKFLSIIGHDLRNPFQALIGYTSILSEEHKNMNDEEVKQSLSEIENASERLLGLVENLLKWASLQSEKLKPDPEWFEVRGLIEYNLRLFAPSAQQKNIKLNKSLVNTGEIYADRNMINTVVRNLISNAIKFTEKEGEVLVEARGDEGRCIIKVADTGIGMPKNILDNLMKIDETTSRFGTDNEAGTGLGLIVCKDMVKAHGGEITVNSEEGEGTQFTITLPRDTGT